jgi:hypothetical protein
MWAAIQKNDPTFGTQSRKAEFDIDIDQKFWQVIRNGTIDPYNNPLDATQCVGFTLGRYVAFRGAIEHLELKHDHVHKRQYTCSDGPTLEGLFYYGVKVDEDKMNQMGFERPTCAPDSTHLLTFCESPRDVDFDPVKFFDFYIDKCHDDAQFFYAKVGTESQRKRWSKECGREVWYGPAVEGSSGFKLSKDTITKNFKEFARKCGCINWEKQTGQGLRALCITLSIQGGLPAADTARLARHRSIKSQESYERDTSERVANRYSVLQARTLDPDVAKLPSHDDVEVENKNPNILAMVSKPKEEEKCSSSPMAPSTVKKAVAPSSFRRNDLNVQDNDDRNVRPKIESPPAPSLLALTPSQPSVYQQHPNPYGHIPTSVPYHHGGPHSSTVPYYGNILPPQYGPPQIAAPQLATHPPQWSLPPHGYSYAQQSMPVTQYQPPPPAMQAYHHPPPEGYEYALVRRVDPSPRLSIPTMHFPMPAVQYPTQQPQYHTHPQHTYHSTTQYPQPPHPHGWY